MKYTHLISILLLSVLFVSCNQKESSVEQTNIVLIPQQSGTHALLVGVSSASADVVWVSGAEGTILRSTNGGQTWQKRTISGTDSLQFRDVYAVSADTAYVMSIGKKGKSRIYKTTNGGDSWNLQFKSHIPDAFFDCMAFWNSYAGIAFSDAVKGEFIVIKTINGGQSWQRIPSGNLPAARPGEGSFAASGSCVATQGDSTAWIATGGSVQPRVLRTTNRGQIWQSFPVPLDGDSVSGAASLIFRDAGHGMVLGGDIIEPFNSNRSAAVTSDGGATWERAKNPMGKIPVYGAAYIPGTRHVVAVGPGGVAVSTDEGKSWQHVDTVDTWAVAFANPQNGWLVGPDGRIVKVSVE